MPIPGRLWRDWHRPAASLWYWRDQGGNEVDLLIEWDNRLTAIDASWRTSRKVMIYGGSTA